MKDDRVTQACWLVLTTRARPPVRSEVGLPRLAHIAKGAMYAPPEAGLGCASAQPLGTKPECGLESTVSQIALLSRIDGPVRTRCATRPRGQGRRETTKIEIRKTNLECPLESMRCKNGVPPPDLSREQAA